MDPIRLNEKRVAQKVEVAALDDLADAVRALGFYRPHSTIALVGGASGVTSVQESRVRAAMAVVAQVAEEMDAVIVDGGTEAGIMAAIGRERYQQGCQFPLIGVAVRKLVTWYDDAENTDGFLLDSNHTHFILTPGSEWGDESLYLAKTATTVAQGAPSLTVLCNGGEIAKYDVRHNLNEGRCVLVLRGTGRYADELATQEDLPDSIIVVDVNMRERLLDALRYALDFGIEDRSV